MKQELLQLAIRWNQNVATAEIAKELGWATRKGEPAVQKVLSWVKRLKKQGVELKDRRAKAFSLTAEEVSEFNRKISR